MDDILLQIGEFGLYQKCVFTLICFATLYSGLYETMSVIFLNSPEHRCKIPGLENDTYDIHSAYQQNLVNIYIPPSTDDDTLDYDQCHLYSFDYNNVKFDNSSRPINASLVKCMEWVYSDSVFKETFTSKFNIVCDDTYLIPLVKSMYIAGKFVGAFVFGNLSDAIGRKITFFVALMMMFGLSFGMSWSSSYTVFAVIMTAIGVTTQGIFPVGFVLGLELVTSSKRIYTCTIEYFFSVGLMVLAVVSYFVRHWHYINIVCSAPAVLFIFYWWLVPESPRWLITKHRYQDAARVVKRMAKVNKRIIESDLWKIDTEEKVSEQTGSVCQLFSGGMLLRTLVILFNWFTVYMTYYGLTLTAGNLEGNFYVNMFVSGLVEIPAYTMVLLLVDRVGRKKVYCASLILGGCACASTIFPIVVNEFENQVIITALAMIGKFGTSAAFSTLNLFSAELFPTVIRNAGMGAGIGTARIGGIVAPYIADSLIGMPPKRRKSNSPYARAVRRGVARGQPAVVETPEPQVQLPVMEDIPEQPQAISGDRIVDQGPAPARSVPSASGSFGRWHVRESTSFGIIWSAFYHCWVIVLELTRNTEQSITRNNGRQ